LTGKRHAVYIDESLLLEFAEQENLDIILSDSNLKISPKKK
jgi:hypothetical protein